MAGQGDDAGPRLSIPARPTRVPRIHGEILQRAGEMSIDDEFDLQLDYDHAYDDYPRSLAGYRLADVLLVNPIEDGMNLVAQEDPDPRPQLCRKRALRRGRSIAGLSVTAGDRSVQPSPRRQPLHVLMMSAGRKDRAVSFVGGGCRCRATVCLVRQPTGRPGRPGRWSLWRPAIRPPKGWTARDNPLDVADGRPTRSARPAPRRRAVWSPPARRACSQAVRQIAAEVAYGRCGLRAGQGSPRPGHG